MIVYVGVPEAGEHVRTVTDVMAETLTHWGVTSYFGMVGHSNLGLADALRRQEAAGRLRYYGIRHEGAAAFAVSAYGKLTGRPAACLDTDDRDRFCPAGSQGRSRSDCRSVTGDQPS